MYEHRRTRPLSLPRFTRRLALHFGVACLLVGLSLGVGMAGYEHYEHLAPRDAFLNAAMLLGGMGPVDKPATPSGKLFAGFYALFAGLIFLILVAILVAPVVHRILHTLHWETEKESRESS
jgi:hypothetical protein